MPLDQLRKAQQMTQLQLAEVLGVTQAEVSTIEHRSNICPSGVMGPVLFWVLWRLASIGWGVKDCLRQLSRGCENDTPKETLEIHPVLFPQENTRITAALGELQLPRSTTPPNVESCADRSARANLPSLQKPVLNDGDHRRILPAQSSCRVWS
jgi:hypothetical protein